jgi:hypothetical protein
MRKDKGEIDVVYLSDGETWDLAENCTIVFRAVYDESQNLALPGQDSMQINLHDLIPFAHQAISNKSIKVFRLTVPHKS